MHDYLKPNLVVDLYYTDFFKYKKCAHLCTSCYTDNSLSNVSPKMRFLVQLHCRGTFEHDA